MPANTPVFSTFEPLSLAIIADWRGPGNPGSTPSTSTPNSWVSEPLNTVRAVPFMPGRRSSRGNSAGLLGKAGAVVCAVARHDNVTSKIAIRKAKWVSLIINQPPPLKVQDFSIFVQDFRILKIYRIIPLDMEAFILAGGASSRMGTDKSQLLIERQTFTERIAETLLQVADSVALVGISGGQAQKSNLRTVADVYPHLGALGGIHAALATCESDWAIVVACDLPFVTAELFSFLASKRLDHDAVGPIQLDGRPQPLAAL